MQGSHFWVKAVRTLVAVGYQPFGSGFTHNGECTLNGARVRQYSCGGDCTDIRGEFLVVCTCGDGCADWSMVILG